MALLPEDAGLRTWGLINVLSDSLQLAWRSDGRYHLVAEKLVARIHQYGIQVRFQPIPLPFSADLDGAEIRIGIDQTDEVVVFTLAHLFGHTAQWNTDPRSYTLAVETPGKVSEELVAELVEYESQASRYGLQLLHETGINDLDQWFSDFAASDRAYLLHYYRTGERLSPTSFWKENTSLIDPLPIPDFTPHRFTFRWAGVVI
jgi:hypothetical protein